LSTEEDRPENGRPILLSGNEAFAYGAFDSGVSVVSSYPGTPSTEITACLSGFDVYTEWAVNEKVALETALGASLAGVRAFTALKHVGLNVASDPLMTASYTGVTGGLVIVVADDPNMYSSQNEQDSRHYARFAILPMLEPSDSQEAYDLSVKAFDLSEKYNTPVLIRSTTRLSHSYSPVKLKARRDKKQAFLKKDPARFVMAPANARSRHILVEERLSEIKAESENFIKFFDNSSADLIISSGTAAEYVKEALGDISLLKLEMPYPLPIEKIKEIAKNYRDIYVIEELDRFLETELITGGVKIKTLPRNPCGELSPAGVERLILGSPQGSAGRADIKLPARPPNMCPGCSHRGLFYALHRLRLSVLGDIGCYTLAYMPPLSALDTCICMGSGVSLAHGVDKADPSLSRKAVAVIGDSTFFHTGINGLINSVYNKDTSTVIILDNRITGMTGHQPNPASGRRANGETAPKINFKALAEAIGVRRVTEVDPFDPEECIKVLKEETAAEEVSVIITNRPCIFAGKGVIKPPLTIDNGCNGCKVCVTLGCPAISWNKSGKRASIDAAQCTGCFLCQKVCKFNAITESSV
jgi:indolepyruvate ferredoxin oxidoreductase alpha subunit